MQVRRSFRRFALRMLARVRRRWEQPTRSQRVLARVGAAVAIGAFGGAVWALLCARLDWSVAWGWGIGTGVGFVGGLWLGPSALRLFG